MMARTMRVESADWPEAMKQPPASPAFSTCSTALPPTPREMPPSPSMPHAFSDLIADAVFQAAAAAPVTPIGSEASQAEAASELESSNYGTLAVLKWIAIFVAWLFAGIALFVASQLVRLLDPLLGPATASLKALVPAGWQARSQQKRQ